jgi:hypothetical protein
MRSTISRPFDKKLEVNMMTNALQELVNKVFSDQKARTEFEKDPETVIARFRLSEPERNAVLATQMKLGLAAAGGVRLDQAVDPIILWSGPVP